MTYHWYDPLIVWNTYFHACITYFVFNSVEEQSALSQILKVYSPLKESEEVSNFKYLCMVHDIYHVQILKEFDRIFEDERSKIIREKWAELIPKVFEVAKNDKSASLQGVLLKVQ